MIETGIFGGSFNPVHKGHISLAERILTEAQLNEVWFVVSPLNPFKCKAGDLLDDDKRLEMTRLALKDHPGLMASDYEFQLPRPSYTWKTLSHLRDDFPGRRFSLIVGADNWLAFDRWSHPEFIKANFPILVYPRRGYPIDPASMPEGVSYINMPLYDLSSSQIRQRLSQGLTIKGFVPDSILHLVEKYYASDSNGRA